MNECVYFICSKRTEFVDCVKSISCTAYDGDSLYQRYLVADGTATVFQYVCVNDTASGFGLIVPAKLK